MAKGDNSPGDGSSSEENIHSLGGPSSSPKSLPKVIQDGHGGVPSNREHSEDNNALSESQSSTNRSTGPVRGQRLHIQTGRRHPRGFIPASGRERPANARNLINPTRITSANAHAGVRIATGPANVGGAPRALHATGVANAPAPFGVGGKPAAVIQAGIANARGAGPIGPLVGAHVGGVAPPGPAPVQQNLGGGPQGLPAMVAPQGLPAMVAPAQVNFDIDAGLSGPPLRRSEVGPFFTFP